MIISRPLRQNVFGEVQHLALFNNTALAAIAFYDGEEWGAHTRILYCKGSRVSCILVWESEKKISNLLAYAANIVHRSTEDS